MCYTHCFLFLLSLSLQVVHSTAVTSSQHHLHPHTLDKSPALHGSHFVWSHLLQLPLQLERKLLSVNDRDTHLVVQLFVVQQRAQLLSSLLQQPRLLLSIQLSTATLSTPRTGGEWPRRLPGTPGCPFGGLDVPSLEIVPVVLPAPPHSLLLVAPPSDPTLYLHSSTPRVQSRHFC